MTVVHLDPWTRTHLPQVEERARSEGFDIRYVSEEDWQRQIADADKEEEES